MKNKIKKSRNLVKEFGRFVPDRQDGKIFDSVELAVKTMAPSVATRFGLFSFRSLTWLTKIW